MAFDLSEGDPSGWVWEDEAEQDAFAATDPIATRLGCTVETLPLERAWLGLQRGTSEGKACTQIHRIPRVPVRPPHDEATRWIKGHRSSTADDREAQDAPHGERRPAGGRDESRDLWEAEPFRPCHACPREGLRWQIDEHRAMNSVAYVTARIGTPTIATHCVNRAYSVA